MLKIRNLHKNYGKLKALDGIDMDIPRGEIYGFVGPNGAGKSTTMKILAGLLVQSSGQVEINGLDIRRNPVKFKEFIGYMPDFFGVYDDLRVSEYLDFYAAIQGVERSEIPSLSERLLELVSLSDKTDAYVNSLSRGMQQRLCLARALVHNPDFLILDEPASGLDPRARIEMKDILRELMQMGKTILISSHILPELAEMCTYIGIIEKGKMMASGSVDEILKKCLPMRRIRIKVLEEQEKLIKAMLEIPKISDIKTSGAFVEAAFDGDDSLLVMLQKYLASAGFNIVHFGEVEGNLESAFLEIVKGNGVPESAQRP